MPSAMGGVAICGLCAARFDGGGRCPSCGSSSYFELDSDLDGAWVARLPAGFPCPDCGAVDRPLAFRGWSRLFSFLIWCGERRAAGYVCPDCALKEAAKSMLITALFGWLSLPSVLFYAWRSTYHNWRSVFAAPAEPLAWGALSVAELEEILDQMSAFAAQDSYWEPPASATDGTPLDGLSRAELAAVLGASGLYELIGVAPSASAEEIRRAYRQAAMRAHPDLDGSGDHDLMVRLNQAWEILGDERLRAAYDFKQKHGP